MFFSKIEKISRENYSELTFCQWQDDFYDLYFIQFELDEIKSITESFKSFISFDQRLVMTGLLRTSIRRNLLCSLDKSIIDNMKYSLYEIFQ